MLSNIAKYKNILTRSLNFNPRHDIEIIADVTVFGGRTKPRRHSYLKHSFSNMHIHLIWTNLYVTTVTPTYDGINSISYCMLMTQICIALNLPVW